MLFSYFCYYLFMNYEVYFQIYNQNTQFDWKPNIFNQTVFKNYVSPLSL